MKKKSRYRTSLGIITSDGEGNYYADGKLITMYDEYLSDVCEANREKPLPLPLPIASGDMI